VLSRGTGLLQLRVKGDSPEFDPSQLQNTLRPFAAISQVEAGERDPQRVQVRRSDGAWAINGQLADLESPLTTSIEGQGEIWHLESGAAMGAPVHLHLEFMRVLRRTGSCPL